MTSLNQTLSEMYTSECASLKLKPNSQVVQYLNEKERLHGDAAHIPELNFSKNFLGRKGVLPLMSVFLKCVMLRLLNLNGVGLTDFACGVLAETLSRHPSVCVVYLKSNFITADSLPALKKLSFALLERAERNPSPAAAVKRKNDETEFEIHIDTNPGIFESVVAELAIIRRSANKADLETAQAAPIPPSALSATSECMAAQVQEDVHFDKKHSRSFAKNLRQFQRRLHQETIYNAKLARRVKANSDGWLILGVYFSCTFSEFPDEAQLIHRKLIPLINYRLRRLRVHLVPVMLHTMEDEDFRIGNTFLADGSMPVHSGRLQPARKSHDSWLADDGIGADKGVLWNASSAEVAEVREFAVRDACDIFVALHSDMFNQSCHSVDWSALETSPDNGAIPTLLYKRKVHLVPPGLQHLFDYKAHLQHSLAESNHAVEHGNGPKPKLADMISERKILMNDFVLFQRKVDERVPKPMRHVYDANYSHVDQNGVVRFALDESFFETLSQDLFCAALAYRQKRLSGLCSRPTVLPPPTECPTIGKQNWRGGNINANPFAHLEHKLGVDDPDRNREPFFSKDISERVVTVAEDDQLNGSLLHGIYGQRGVGRTTQLRAVAARIQGLKHKNANMIVSHSVTSGSRTLLGVMTGILQQLVPHGAAVFEDWPSFDDDDALCQAFCDTLKRRSVNIPRFTSCLWILLDDDDAVDFGSSFSEAFETPSRYELLRSAVPHEGMQLRVIFTTNLRPKPHNDLAVSEVPVFDEIEAADLFVSIMLGIDQVPDNVLQEVKHAAHYLVLQKKHGIKPLYLYLAAREMLQSSEEVSMVNIAEQLPGTVEELLSSCIRGTCPKDLLSVMDAVAFAPTPLNGAMNRHAISACRQSPAFSGVASTRWFSKRRWGDFSTPALSSGCLLIAFLTNFLHLFSNCTRSRNRGVYTNPRNNFDGSVWRQELTLFSRTTLEVLSTRQKERKTIGIKAPLEGAIPSNVWETTLPRVSLIRDDVHTTRGLSNFFDVLKFFSTPHRAFALMDAKRHDELRLLVERLLVLLCADAQRQDASQLAPQRITSHDIRSKLNDLRISQQFAANDPEGLRRHIRQHPLGLLMEYIKYFTDNWSILLRHPVFLYSCPQYAPPVLRADIEAAQREYAACCLNQDCSFVLAKKCFETALLLTSQAQEQLSSSELSKAPRDITNEAAINGNAGPRLKTFLVASRVSKSFVVTYRSITDAKPHEITPTMASPGTQLAAAEDENGGKSFGYVGVILMPPENVTKTNADFGFGGASKNFAQQSLAKGTFFLSVKAHVNALSALEIVETRHATRIASSAYYDPEIVITALLISRDAGDASRLQMVGRLQLQQVQRPMVSSIGLAPVTHSQLSERGVDDGQRCPMVCVSVKNMLHVFEGQRFGHDNLYNRKGSIAAQVFSGHDNRIVHYGFSPAGAKVFSIDVSGHCFVWGTPESPCSGTILAVTDFGTLPTFARFVDHETLLVVTSRGILLWNSGTSQIQQLLTNPTRQQLDGNYAMLHYQPPPYVYGSLEDTELLQLPPHVKVHRLLEQLREKKHPTVTYMSFDGVAIFDSMEKQIKIFKRQHIPPQNELECDQPPLLLFAKEASHSCCILPHVSTSDAVGNNDVEGWRWFLGSRSAVAIDTKENMVKCFDLLKGEQVPMFFAVKSGDRASVFAPLDEAVLAGESEDRIVVAEKEGTIHVLTKTQGPLLYPTPPLCTM